MKRGFFILVFGLILAAGAFGCVYFACMAPARELHRNKQPELAWLKEEFNLSEAEFKRISELHHAYLPQCQEMCRKIDAKNSELQKLVSSAKTMSPKIERAVAVSSKLRAECQMMMLQHFFQVSQSMQPEQSRRYLAWVKEKTFLPDYGMNARK